MTQERSQRPKSRAKIVASLRQSLGLLIQRHASCMGPWWAAYLKLLKYQLSIAPYVLKKLSQAPGHSASKLQIATTTTKTSQRVVDPNKSIERNCPQLLCQSEVQVGLMHPRQSTHQGHVRASKRWCQNVCFPICLLGNHNHMTLQTRGRRSPFWACGFRGTIHTSAIGHPESNTIDKPFENATKPLWAGHLVFVVSLFSNWMSAHLPSVFWISWQTITFGSTYTGSSIYLRARSAILCVRLVLYNAYAKRVPPTKTRSVSSMERILHRFQNVDHLVLEKARDPLHVTPDRSNGMTRDVARKTIWKSLAAETSNVIADHLVGLQLGRPHLLVPC